MEGTGRRWSIKGAESTLLLRSVCTSKDWDAYWEAHCKLKRKRLYGNILPKLGYSDEYFKKSSIKQPTRKGYTQIIPGSHAPMIFRNKDLGF